MDPAVVLQDQLVELDAAVPDQDRQHLGRITCHRDIGRQAVRMRAGIARSRNLLVERHRPIAAADAHRLADQRPDLLQCRGQAFEIGQCCCSRRVVDAFPRGRIGSHQLVQREMRAESQYSLP